MIVLFTDFGNTGPYTGEMLAVLEQQAPGVPVIPLFSDAPMGDPYHSAYLLAAYAPRFPQGTVFVCVVDPGVGSSRAAILVEADNRQFVGPDNGLLEMVIRQSETVKVSKIDWVPENLSSTFHGRDLFAPVAAKLHGHEAVEVSPFVVSSNAGWKSWPDQPPVAIYIDHYGNVMLGIKAATLTKDAVLGFNGNSISYAKTYAEASEPFWYENSVGLVELAISGGSIASELGFTIGSEVSIN